MVDAIGTAGRTGGYSRPEPVVERPVETQIRTGRAAISRLEGRNTGAGAAFFSSDMGIKASFITSARKGTEMFVRQMADLNDLLGDTGTTIAAGNERAWFDRPRLLESRIVTEQRDVTEQREIFREDPVWETRDLMEERAVFEMQDITEARTLFETRDLTEERTLYETRDIIETRTLYEDQAIYGGTTVSGSVDLSGYRRVRDAGINGGAEFTVQVGDGEQARIQMNSDSEIEVRIGDRQEKVRFLAVAGRWRDGLVEALNMVDGLSASINDDGQLQLETDGAPITITNGSNDPLDDFGIAEGTTGPEIIGYEPVAIGEEDVVVGTEEVAIGTETVVIGTEEIAIGTETVVVGAQEVEVGREAVVVGSESVQTGVVTVSDGMETIRTGVERVQTATLAPMAWPSTGGGLFADDERTLDAPDQLRIAAQIDLMDATLGQVRSAWQAAGMQFSLALDDLGLGEAFLADIATAPGLARQRQAVSRTMQAVNSGAAWQGFLAVDSLGAVGAMMPRPVNATPYAPQGGANASTLVRRA